MHTFPAIDHLKATLDDRPLDRSTDFVNMVAGSMNEASRPYSRVLPLPWEGIP